MKKIPTVVCSCILFLGAILSSADFAAADSGLLYVSVRESKLRRNPDFLSPVLGSVSYGDALAHSSREGLWYKVKSPDGKNGYLHQSAVTNRRVVLNPDASFQRSNANNNTIVMAGKGFNKEVEKQYAAKSRGVNYKAVDKMEASTVSQAELSSFAKAGKLGGAK
jgi:hypothetical protein